MSAPIFTVIIPAYNAERTVGDSVRSVLAQTRQDFEVIVVDDGSGDSTVAEVEKAAAGDARVRVLRQANTGPASAKNAGIAAAGGSYLSFLDADDLWMPTYLAGMGSALDANPSASFAYTDAWLFDEPTRRIRRLTAVEHHEELPVHGASPAEILALLLANNFVMTSTTCRARALAEVGGFDDALRGAEDWDLWIRLVAAGGTAVQVPGQLILQRDQADSLSKDLSLMFRHMELVLERAAERTDWPAPAREAARRRLPDVRRHRAVAEARGPLALARGVYTRLRLAQERRRAAEIWRPEPPAEVAAAFPELMRGYGRPMTGGR